MSQDMDDPIPANVLGTIGAVSFITSLLLTRLTSLCRFAGLSRLENPKSGE